MELNVVGAISNKTVLAGAFHIAALNNIRGIKRFPEPQYRELISIMNPDQRSLFDALLGKVNLKSLSRTLKERFNQLVKLAKKEVSIRNTENKYRRYDPSCHRKKEFDIYGWMKERSPRVV